MPLAIKWGVGDGVYRGELIERASNDELDELRNGVGPRMDEIAHWLTNLSDYDIRTSDTVGLYLHLMDAYEESEPGYDKEPG